MFFPNYSNILGGKNHHLENYLKNFPAGPVTRTLVSQYREPGFKPWTGTGSHMSQLRVCMLQLRFGTAK